MNGFDDQRLFHRLLRLLAEESETSQREPARRMGISPGKLNYCVSQPAERGPRREIGEPSGDAEFLLSP